MKIYGKLAVLAWMSLILGCNPPNLTRDNGPSVQKKAQPVSVSAPATPSTANNCNLSDLRKRALTEVHGMIDSEATVSSLFSSDVLQGNSIYIYASFLAKYPTESEPRQEMAEIVFDQSCQQQSANLLATVPEIESPAPSPSVSASASPSP
jgi:hypothetical protein